MFQIILGAKSVKCKVQGGFERRVSFVGDFIIVLVIELRYIYLKIIFKKLKKGEIYKSLQ